MDNSALYHTLKAGGGLHFQIFRRVDNRGKLVINMGVQQIAQLLDIDFTALQHLQCICIFGHGQQQMFQRGKFMGMIACNRQSPAQGIFKFLRQHPAIPFLVAIAGGVHFDGQKTSPDWPLLRRPHRYKPRKSRHRADAHAA